MAALPYPPIAEGFLSLFDCTAAAVVWENPALGTFGVVVPSPAARGAAFHQRFTVPEKPLPSLAMRTVVVEVPIPKCLAVLSQNKLLSPDCVFVPVQKDT